MVYVLFVKTLSYHLFIEMVRTVLLEVHFVVVVLSVCVVLTSCAFETAGARIEYATFPGSNQVYNVAQSRGNTSTIVYLGDYETVGECARACEEFSEKRCWSFTHHGIVGSKWSRQCFGITSPRWSPTPDVAAITSGVLDWPCRSNSDCSLNGECHSGKCACRKAWSGRRCEKLMLLPARRDEGYRGIDGGRNTSSWGGAVLYDNGTQSYHMWAAEMTEHCGIGAWAQNSRIIRAESKQPGGPYLRQQVVYEVFSHEPEVIRAPTGEYVMYFTASLRSEHGICNCCKANVSKCDGSTGPSDCPSMTSPFNPRLRDSDPTLMAYSSHPEGPWSTAQPIWPKYQGSDTNFAPIILPNNSLVAIWRSWTERGSRCYLATATDWRDASTYVQHTEEELFPDLGTAGTEDPFLYRDIDGTYHAIFHHMYGYDTETQWWLDAVGGHAFSEDGISWTYSGVAWGNSTTTQQGNVVEFTDGTSFRFTRRERPHLVFDQKTGELAFLVTAAQYGTGKNPGQYGDNGDASFTLLQPILSSTT